MLWECKEVLSAGELKGLRGGTDSLAGLERQRGISIEKKGNLVGK